MLDISTGIILVNIFKPDIGAISMPMSELVMMSFILNAVGLPMEGVAIIFAVDKVLDMFRTSVNVLSDSASAVVISKLKKY